jgi:hypothetical protein
VRILEQAPAQAVSPSFKRRVVQGIAMVLVVCLVHLSLASVVLADEPKASAEERRESTASQFGLGAASFFLTLPYGLVKVVYASFGGLIGGVTYALTAGNERAANAVWHTSLRGTYIITPDHLKGDKAVRFFGVPPDSMSEVASEPVLQALPESSR